MDTLFLNKVMKYLSFFDIRKLNKYIKENYLETACDFTGAAALEKTTCAPMMAVQSAAAPDSLENALESLDESFAEMLFRKIDESKMTDSQCYKKAGVDRKLFSKIRSNPNYKPSKPTVVAFALALELDLEETKSLLSKAGFALSHSSKFDVIVEYFILQKNYNLFAVNEALYEYDQLVLFRE